MARIGLIAGYGKITIVFADAAKAKGDTVIGFGLKGVADTELEKHVSKMHWLEWGDLKKGVMLLALERINKVIFLGKINKELFFKEADKLDSDAKKAMDKIKDKKDYAILNEATNILKKVGVDVIDSTTYLKELLPVKGTLTRRKPSESESEDIDYGKKVALSLAGFDIGQTVIVKDKTVIAVEAMEGTDEAISRAGALTGGGFVVVKMARPNQDMRFDVPLIGPGTLTEVIKAKGKVVALEEGKTILMDKEELLKLADDKDISIVVI